MAKVHNALVSGGANDNPSSFHHHDFPEIRVEAGSAAEAAPLLGSQFRRALDSALTDWRREPLVQALIDVNAPGSPRIVVREDPHDKSSCVHHRDFPEIRVEADSTREAVRLLDSQLHRVLDTALSNWERVSLEQAIIDVNSFP